MLNYLICLYEQYKEIYQFNNNINFQTLIKSTKKKTSKSMS